MTGRRRAALMGVAFAVVLPVLAALAFLDGRGAHADRPASAQARPAPAPTPVAAGPIDGTVVVSARTLGHPIPPGFVGLSIEYPALPYYTGPNPNAIDPVFEQLVRNLAPGQRPVLRIGGDSSDSTWWPVRGMARPLGVSFTLTNRWLALTRGLAGDLRARMILGVDLEAGLPALAAAEARALVAGVGKRSVFALEPGNEPTRYTMFPWYQAADGRPVWARRRPYRFANFSRDFAGAARVMPPGVALAGPTLGGWGFMADLGRFLREEPRVRVVTVHRYPLNRCRSAPGDRRWPTVARLLSPDTSRGLGLALARYVGIVRKRGLVFRVDEMNSVACGGKVGVSTTFASALWALDTLFAMAQAGVDGVNVHTFPGAAYQLFTLTQVGGRWQASVRPEYYGLLAFALAAPPGSRLVAVRVSGQPKLWAWATRTAGGAVRLVLINVDVHRAHTLQIRGALSGPGILSRLVGPSAYASTGVRLGGAAVDPLTGQLRPTALAVLSPRGGRYRLTVPAASAALVTFAGAG